MFFTAIIPEFLHPNMIFTVTFASSIHDANAAFATAKMIGGKKKEESSWFPHKMAHLFLYNLQRTKTYIVVVWIFINLIVKEGKHCSSLILTQKNRPLYCMLGHAHMCNLCYSVQFIVYFAFHLGFVDKNKYRLSEAALVSGLNVPAETDTSTESAAAFQYSSLPSPSNRICWCG